MKIYSTKAVLAFITFVSLTALCCGKRTPPVPPAERVTQRITIRGIQQGSRIVLNWTMPARNSSPDATDYISRIDVYRLAEPIDSPTEINEEEFSSRSTLIESIKINDEDFALKNFSYTDSLKFSDQTVRLTYAVRLVNSAGQKAVFSNFLTIEPSSKIAQAPTDLRFQVSQDKISISWAKPLENVDGSTPPNILGYNIYRKTGSENELKKLNSSPLVDNKYSDFLIEFPNTYSYVVRTLSLGAEGLPVESLDSEIETVSLIDNFAPSAPESITIAASPNTISIFFAANPEKDISGYKIFRTIDQNLPLSEWNELTPVPIRTNTFQDRDINTGVKYFYYIKAVDSSGNQSDPSAIISETAQ